MGQGGVALLQLAQAVILARLLTATDFGVGAACYTTIAAAQIFWDFGSSAATIHRKDIAPEQLSGLYLLNLILGVAAALVIVLAAPYIAALIDFKEAESAVRWVAVGALL